MLGLFTGFPRDPDGSPVFDEPVKGTPMTERAFFCRQLWLNGITDRATQEKLWKEKRDRRAAER
ncbi:MAG: hypothetical protein JWO38_7120 [Gemmataceae bacterium]|nr:hypothetical protein [Gemmataceae bacterium]